MTLSDIRVMYVGLYIGEYDMYCPSRYYQEQFPIRVADVNSKFKIVRDLKYAYCRNERLPLRSIVTGETYYIDDIVVDEKTWEDVYKIISDNIQAITGKAPKQLKIMESDDTVIWSFVTDGLQGKKSTVTIFDESFPFANINEEIDKRVKEFLEIEDECMKKFFKGLKGDNSMKNLTITNYKYNPETKTTTIWWSDNSQTSVTADSDTEANEFTGFCAACAKKLFGNKSTYLNQFDKWTVKIPERERLAAEKKAKEDKEREEAKARKAAKKAEHRAKREVELLAKEFADNYNHESVWEQAKKLAIKKYGVPADYFLDERYNCHCGCKEFDVTDENDISD